MPLSWFNSDFPTRHMNISQTSHLSASAAANTLSETAFVPPSVGKATSAVPMSVCHHFIGSISVFTAPKEREEIVRIRHTPRGQGTKMKPSPASAQSCNQNG